MRKLLCLLLVLWPATGYAGDPSLAVVRIPSHGASATIIATGKDGTYLLGCAHAYEGAAKAKPMLIDVPRIDGRVDGQQTTITLVAVDYAADLSLVKLGCGPLPNVCAVAPAGHRPNQRIVAAGYDKMAWPCTVAWATIIGHTASTTYTREQPIPGRSGGGLIDWDAGLLIGVCQGYEVAWPKRGLYVSHAAIVAFLKKSGYSAADALDRAPAKPPVQQVPPQYCPR